MIAHHLTLVLGAGASCPYGFPTGYQLRKKIIELSPDLYSEYRSEIVQFQNAFRDSHCTSIDTFLAEPSNDRHVIWGKRAIAHVLLPIESSSRRVFREDGDWYQIFADALLAPPPPDRTPAKVHVVTFNYDRSLEAFLLIAIRNRFNLPPDEARQKMDALVAINHVYGWLGQISVDPGSEFREAPFVRYGGPADATDAANPHLIIRAQHAET